MSILYIIYKFTTPLNKNENEFALKKLSTKCLKLISPTLVFSLLFAYVMLN